MLLPMLSAIGSRDASLKDRGRVYIENGEILASRDERLNLKQKVTIYVILFSYWLKVMTCIIIDVFSHRLQ